MRDLNTSELTFVSGGCHCPPPPPSCPPARTKNNNGYGNGPESGPPPGNSGANNPQLTSDNAGPRGPR